MVIQLVLSKDFNASIWLGHITMVTVYNIGNRSKAPDKKPPDKSPATISPLGQMPPDNKPPVNKAPRTNAP